VSDPVSVQYIKKILDKFIALPWNFQPLRCEISEPWHFNESREIDVPFGYEKGLYLYTKPNVPEWNLPMINNENPVWYVGKSEGDVGGRVWNHVLPVTEKQTGLPCIPRFKYHQWSEIPSVPEDVRDSVASGIVVVYTISVRSESQVPFLAELLEKYVLIEYVLAEGKLPVLNFQL
jgi:hypothetical protein